MRPLLELKKNDLIFLSKKFFKTILKIQQIKIQLSQELE